MSDNPEGVAAERYWEGRWRDEAAENDRLRTSLAAAEQLAYELKYAAAGGEDVPGSANAVTVSDVDRWRREAAASLAAAEARCQEYANWATTARANEAAAEARATQAERERDEACARIEQLIAALGSTAIGQQDGARRSALYFLSHVATEEKSR